MPIPTVAAREAVEHYDLKRVGQTEECRQQFFAISAERELTHPAVVMITSAARDSLFAPGTRKSALAPQPVARPRARRGR